MEFKMNKNIVDLKKAKVMKNLQFLFSKETLEKLCFVPFFEGKNHIYIAIESNDVSKIKLISFLSNKIIVPYISSKSDIETFMEQIFKETEKKKELTQMVIESKWKDENLENAKNISNKPVVWLVDKIIQDAIEKRSSDIHIEPFKSGINIRFRVDGVLTNCEIIEVELAKFLVSRIKLMANLDITEKRISQDGKIAYEFKSHNYDIRVSTIPVIYGEKIVLRILDRENFDTSLDMLGLGKKSIENIRKIIGERKGIILITGPTGSGKSTTLFAMMSEINKESINITTIEDPVEYQLDGVNQISVNEKVGLTFHNGLRSILRQDPDVIMIGEIRDEITAQIACRSAITGHLVLSTLHTKNSKMSMPRLLDMNVPEYMLSESILTIISQRLVRRVCKRCEEHYEASEYERSILGNEIKSLTRGKGCEKCNNTGYSGRLVVAEMLIKKQISDSSGNEKSEFILLDGKDIFSIGKERVIEGTTTFEEMMRCCN